MPKSSKVDEFLSELTDKQEQFLLYSVLEFQQHDAVKVEMAKILLAMGILQLSPIKEFKLRTITVEHGCVRFTNKGRKAAKVIQRNLKISPNGLSTLPDPVDAAADSDQTDLKFVMHDRRLIKELASPNAGKVIGLYAFGFLNDVEKEWWDKT